MLDIQHDCAVLVVSAAHRARYSVRRHCSPPAVNFLDHFGCLERTVPPFTTEGQ
jgi:hypothetical protein